MHYPDHLSLENTGPYRVDTLNTTLDQIRALVPDCTAVRTDRFIEGRVCDANHLRLILERGQSRVATILTPELHFATGGKIQRELDLSSGDLDLLAQTGFTLAELNPLGAWCLEPTAVPQMDVSSREFNGEPLQRQDYLADTCSMLGEDLPKAGSVGFIYRITGQQTTNPRRRCFINLHSTDGLHQLAALDAAGLPLHARQQILKRDPDKRMLALNLFRMRHWGRQMGCSADVLAELVPVLMFCATSLHITKMQFDRS